MGNYQGVTSSTLNDLYKEAYASMWESKEEKEARESKAKEEEFFRQLTDLGDE